MSIESQADFDAEALRAMERETRAAMTTAALDEIGASSSDTTHDLPRKSCTGVPPRI